VVWRCAAEFRPQPLDLPASTNAPWVTRTIAFSDATSTNPAVCKGDIRKATGC